MAAHARLPPRGAHLSARSGDPATTRVRSRPGVVRRQETAGDRPERAWVVGLVTLVAVAAVVGARLADAAHGQLGNFVLAGAPLAQRARLPAGIPFHSSGYDGQFFYRLARDPADISRTAFGITFDDPYRVARIGYPALAWLVSLGGRAALVPAALVAINVLSLAGLGWEGGVLARQAGRNPFWGLLLPGFFGFLLSVSRDTAEPLEAVMVVAGLLALRSRRPWVAALVLSVAVLTRETSTLVVAAVGLVDLWRRVDAHRHGELGPKRIELASWVVPSVVFFGWQGALWDLLGRLPLRSDARGNLGIPFAGLVHAASQRIPALPGRADVVWAVQVGVMLVAWVSGLRWQASPRRPVAARTASVERLAFGLTLALMLFLPTDIWVSASSDLRSLSQAFLLAAILAISARGRPRVFALFAAGAWVMVALLRITSL